MHARLQDWRIGLLQWSTSGPRTLAFGEGFGRDRTRTVLTQTGEERRIQYGWHNHYLSLLTSCGLVGLLAFLGVVGYALVGLHRLCTRADGAVAAPALLSLLAAQLTYFVPFDAHYVQYLLLGAAISMVATAARKASANQPKGFFSWTMQAKSSIAWNRPDRIQRSRRPGARPAQSLCYGG